MIIKLSNGIHKIMEKREQLKLLIKTCTGLH